jgi:molecular chaperone GrpE
MADEDTHTPLAPPEGADPAHVGPRSEPAEVATLQAERDELHNRLLRKTAEFENYRKRVERERRELADQTVVDLLLDLLGVVDDFDLALTTEGGDVGAYRRGIELIHAKLHDVFRRQGVRPLESLGSLFDPNLHEAVSHEESPSHREGEVIAEMRRGYMIRERLLRPAMVKVAKA